MILFPAIDIRRGKCVQLTRGRAEEETIFSDDPVAMAKHWESQGARWLHIVDLDGAFSGTPVNIKLIKSMCQAVSIPVQLGGGVRDKNTATAYLQAGVTRLIIGTMALEDRETFKELCQLYPDQIGVSLDAENGTIKTRGWVADSGLTVEAVVPELIEAGAAFILYTDIARDGTGLGIDRKPLERLAALSSIPIVAAGGVANMDDIKILYDLSKTSVLQGAVSGKAIYLGTLDVQEAELWLKGQQ